MQTTPRFVVAIAVIVFVGALISAPRLCAAQTLSSRSEALLLNGAFHPIKTVAALPVAVKNTFAAPEMRRRFDMAETEKPFQRTDLIMVGKRLPDRRLIAAGVAGGAGRRRCFVFYEQGGMSPVRCLSIFDIAANGKSAHLLWHGYNRYDDAPPSNKPVRAEALRNALAHGAFSKVKLPSPYYN